MIRSLSLAALSGLLLATAATAQPAGDRPMGPRGQGAEMLERFDTNKDGKIDEAEFKAGRAETFKKFDTTGTGKVTLAQFQQGLEKMREERRQEMAKRRFDRMDADKDGTITQAEFDAAAQRMFDRMDRDDDGTLSPGDRPHHRGHR